MLSEADLIAKRAALRWLAKPHPHWTHQDLAVWITHIMTCRSAPHRSKTSEQIWRGESETR